MPSEEETIIIGGGKNAARSGLLPRGLMPIRDTLKHYSTWALAVLVASPDLYQAASSLGMLADEAMPQAVVWSIRVVAGVGLIAKFISQRKPQG
ncbi:hypothetical protein N5C16_00560 [Stenotrophomonas sp. GD03908]|uniref:hypothetical protein n=1 Tax=Stenotrophomonas sp. GD03908 TaxID=2975403 RepID=UPI00244BD502|nr:hypothetical protein [Stenotrophomonas sp. GD03908]MDH0977757.1 hypothetical protein [Stenotrophomonas sp. GD03908]